MNGASRRLSFADNGICAMLFGQHHMNVARIEQRLSVSLVTRGNEVFIQGEADGDVAAAADVLQSLYSLLEQGHVIGHEDVDAALRMVVGDHPVSLDDRRHFKTERRAVKPRSPNQAAYLSALERHDLVFALGPAGTGKTYLAVAAAVAMLKERRIDRLILSRPAVEAGERLGFLPGDLKEKVDPYLRPLYDALHDMLPEGKLVQRFDSGQIEIAPLAFMRGRTLSNAYVILDEAQNATAAQMKMFLTRLGDGSRMVVTGDPSQVDLPHGMRSGLVDAVERLETIPGIATVRFDRGDVVRHPLVARIVEAYEGGDPSPPAIGNNQN
ncbi:MAG: PhoH family protein [Geminicoccaceae bacterium]|nr:PhoH family protein [Geminicoccaceae bacterium]